MGGRSQRRHLHSTHCLMSPQTLLPEVVWDLLPLDRSMLDKAQQTKQRWSSHAFSFHPCSRLSPTSLQPLPPPLVLPLSAARCSGTQGVCKVAEGSSGSLPLTRVNSLAGELLRHLCFIVYRFAHQFSATHTGPPSELIAGIRGKGKPVLPSTVVDPPFLQPSAAWCPCGVDTTQQSPALPPWLHQGGARSRVLNGGGSWP